MKMFSKLQPRVTFIATFFMSVTAQINLALHGTVAQETTYVDRAGISYDAHLAIDGPANNNWEDGCSSTGANQPSQWWGLFLPKLAYITNVKFYLRKDAPQRMNGFRLYFGNDSVYEKVELCYRDSKKQAYRNLNQSIDCDLSPTKNIYFFNRYTFVELCYIEIYGCWKGFLGAKCAEPCQPKCIDQHCNPANGNCVWGCDPKNCMNEKCNISTGVCIEGCVLERAGQFCSKYNLAYKGKTKKVPVDQISGKLSVDGNRTSCNSFSFTGTSSYLQVELESLSVITTVDIFFGDETTYNDGHAVYCSNTTDTWNDGTLLYSGRRLEMNMKVFAICMYLIYVPPLSIKNSMVELCEIEIGGCPYGRYGVSCERLCLGHCKGSCDLDSGNCSRGCLDGWVGEQCDTECSVGYFGFNCMDFCETCFNFSCDALEGKCIAGCIDGYRGCKCTTSVLANSNCTDSSLSTQIGLCIGTFLLGALLTVGLSMIIRRRRSVKQRQKNKRAEAQSQEQQYDNLGMESISRYQELSPPSITNDYDQINAVHVNQ